MLAVHLSLPLPFTLEQTPERVSHAIRVGICCENVPSERKAGGAIRESKGQLGG